MGIYYKVCGQRAVFKGKLTGDGPAQVRSGTTAATFTRFESLSLQDAEAFATDVYRHEKIICTIEEVTT